MIKLIASINFAIERPIERINNANFVYYGIIILMYIVFKSAATVKIKFFMYGTVDTVNFQTNMKVIVLFRIKDPALD